MRTLHHDNHGFTLIELMIVVTVIGILAALAIPMFSAESLSTRLHEAKPYLLEIAARQRMYRIDNGKYCCSATTTEEDELAARLGVPLKETGNFCFVVICRDSALCEKTVSTNFVTSSEKGDPAIEFEVWALLRADSGATISGPQGGTCRNATDKRPPAGWVHEASASTKGREGQAIVLRYPPPPNGLDAASGADGVHFQWLDGLSESHVFAQ